MTCPLCASRQTTPLLTLPTAPGGSFLGPEADQRPSRKTLRLSLCGNCEFVFLGGKTVPLSHPSQSPGAFRDPALERYRKSLRDLLLARLGADHPVARAGRRSSIIDVGCGDGSFAGLFVGHARVTGVESQPDDAKAARRKGIRVLRARLDRTLVSRERGKHDLVLCTHVLEHQPDPHAFLARLRGLLRPGGYAFIEVPSFDRIKGSQAGHSIIPEHVGYYTAGTLAWTLDRHFSVVSLEQEFHGQFVRALVRNDRVPARAFAAAHRSWLKELEKSIGGFRRGGVVMWGAGTRGLALLAMSRVVRERVKAVVDSDPGKQGLKIPGTRLKIGAPSDLKRLGPEAVLISAVTYRAGIEKELRKRGYDGRIIG